MIRQVILLIVHRRERPAMPDTLRKRLLSGLVIPAHPLALDAHRKLDERGMARLSRYYHAAGAGGIAVGVHTSQFAIRNPEHGLLKALLGMTAATIKDLDQVTGRSTVMVAGVCGPLAQALTEARLARECGYDAALVSLAGSPPSLDELVRHLSEVAQVIPIIGFFLQPAIGGIPLNQVFWRRAAEIENLVAIKIAPFDRYATIDVVSGVVESGRVREVALYTGNDDSIVVDLLTRFRIPFNDRVVDVDIVGGLLGQWACWTATAVKLYETCRSAMTSGTIPAGLLTLGAQLTQANGAIFDVENKFRGCIPGIHYVLRRQGLLDTINCLDPAATLSPGQKERIDLVIRAYPHLVDGEFVHEHLEKWST